MTVWLLYDLHHLEGVYASEAAAQKRKAESDARRPQGVREAMIAAMDVGDA